MPKEITSQETAKFSAVLTRPEPDVTGVFTIVVTTRTSATRSAVLCSSFMVFFLSMSL